MTLALLKCLRWLPSALQYSLYWAVRYSEPLSKGLVIQASAIKSSSACFSPTHLESMLASPYCLLPRHSDLQTHLPSFLTS